MDYLVAHPLIPFVSFTGSVANGRRVEQTAAGTQGTGFKSVGLELGGKDAAYVREGELVMSRLFLSAVLTPSTPLSDSDPAYAAENIVDGAMFNSGQSCCGIERVYVHEKVYDAFVEEAVKVVKVGSYFYMPRLLADLELPCRITFSATLARRPLLWGLLFPSARPLSSVRTLLGLVSYPLSPACAISLTPSFPVSKGAKALIPESHFAEAKEGTTYVAPQVLIDVDHSMKVMSEETFGPVFGIMKVRRGLRAPFSA